MFTLTEIEGIGPDLYLEPPLQPPPTSRLAVPGTGTSKKKVVSVLLLVFNHL